MLQRRAWILRGVLDYNLSMSLLTEIVAKYERIDAVPQGYHQAELYLQQDAVKDDENEPEPNE